jgi:hypothetical protein
MLKIAGYFGAEYTISLDICGLASQRLGSRDRRQL